MNIATRTIGSAGLALALLLCAASASAQMYKWVDANGRTHFTTSPPPPTAKTVTVRAASQAPAVPLPYALAQAVRNAPVVLFSAEGCTGCDMGRSFLRKRGIPFTEKTISTGNDEVKLKEAGGNGQLPFFLVGQKRILGFEAGVWDSALTAAAYPLQTVLPSNYVHANPIPASPPPTQVAAVAPPRASVAQQKKREVEQERTAPPGFQF